MTRRIRTRIKRLASAVALAAPFLPLFSAPLSASETGGQTEQERLVALLDEQTEVATSIRVNADYLPGMVTVLDGDELRVRGARNVWEALSLVPGISLGMEFSGELQILSRGVGHSHALTNTKFMLDGVSVNSAFTTLADPLLAMPIEQVERIEVIRGAGSSIRGEYAYSGVVNVISRRGSRRVFAQGGSFSTYGAGAQWYEEDPGRGFRVSANLAGYDTDGPDMLVPRDNLYAYGAPELSHAPGPANEDRRYRGLVVDLTWGEWSASYKQLESAFGDQFGINHILPPPTDRLVTTHRYQILDLGRAFELTETLDARLRLEGMLHEQQRDRLYVFPAGMYGNDEPIFMDRDYQEHRWLAELELDWRPDDQHQLLFAMDVSETAIDEAGWEWYGYPWPLPETWIDELERTTVGVVVQDQYRLSDQLTIIGTLRHDDYSDLGGLTSPRLAAVWRLTDEHLLKAQYARSFRPPTFYEINFAAQGRIDPSEIRTLELGYIWKRADSEWRITLFDSRLDDPILFSSGLFFNEEGLRLRGAEMEYRQHLGRSLRLDANLSYVDAEQRDSGNAVPGGADWLANLGLFWNPSHRWSLALQAQYVGERARTPEDSRGPLRDQITLDLGFNYRTPISGVSLSGGLKNLTDLDVRYPQQLTSDLIYPDDYPRPGRQWWLTIGMEFK